MTQPSAFSRLHEDIQRVLWDMKWESLRDLQVDSINAWFDSDADLVLMASTASGKTEAAFLPILSTLAAEGSGGSIRVLYVGPLKALINDQFRRVEDLCQRAEIPVYRWHGDVAASKKHEVLKSPSGVLLITPESLEALLMRRGREARRLFAKLTAVIIDEMHSFIDSCRGRQLCAQLRRIDALRNTATRRIGLSATLGDEGVALEWIRRSDSSDSRVIRSSIARNIELLVKTFVHEKPRPSDVLDTLSEASQEDGDGSSHLDESSGLLSIAGHLFDNLRGATNLVFCNRKSDIEVLADDLAELCERKKQLNEFVVHHGSLSKQIREETEGELQSGRPRTAICSSTLEMGIDVGYVDSVAQVGPPHSVSALTQRLGRSGRRAGQPCRLWLYVPVLRRDAKSPLPDRLYPGLLQSISLVELMLEKWVEPPWLVGEDYSTLIQQTLSLICERGGINARDAYELLGRIPAFSAISPSNYAMLLKDLGRTDLVSQAANNDLILGLAGEKITGHYDFFAAFETPDEYDVVEGSRHIGSMEVLPGLYQVGDNILLAAKRWTIVDIDDSRRTFLVQRARNRKPPIWARGGGHIHRRVREKMLEVLQGKSTPSYVNPTSLDVLTWARSAAIEANMSGRSWVQDGEGAFLFTWTGSKANNALYLWLSHHGVAGMNYGIAIGVTSPLEKTRTLLQDFISASLSGEELCRLYFGDEIPPTGKHGEYLSPALRARAYASAHLDIEEAIACATGFL